MSKNWKPKKGEKVIAINSSRISFKTGGFKKYKVYIVDQLVGTTIKVKKDEAGKENGWDIKNFIPNSEAAQILFCSQEQIEEINKWKK